MLYVFGPSIIAIQRLLNIVVNMLLTRKYSNLRQDSWHRVRT